MKVCRRGHKMTPENIRISKRLSGHTIEICKACDRLLAQQRSGKITVLPPELGNMPNMKRALELLNQEIASYQAQAEELEGRS